MVADDPGELLDSNDEGQIIWNKSYGTNLIGHNGPYVKLFNEDSNSFWMFSADAISSTVFLELDLNGNVIWDKRFFFFMDGLRTSSGDIVCTSLNDVDGF